MKRKFTLILAALLLLTYTSCGSESGGTNDTTPSGETTTEGAAQDEYVFPKLDMGGKEFVMLQWDVNYESYNDIEVDTVTGDIINDAIWERNSKIEDMFKVKIVQRREEEANDSIKRAVTAGDNTYQAAFPLTYSMGALITEGMFHDLTNGSGFNFDKPWWDKAVLEDAYVGKNKSLYFASSDLTLHNFEMTWCLYFNRRMVEDLGLDMPYQLVQDGKWTFDELYKYISTGANLNGDENWWWNKDGNCVYGFTSMSPDFMTQAYVATNNKQIRFVDGEPKLMAGTGNFYDVADKLTKIFGEQGTAFFSNDRTNGSHYESVYAAGRAMFCGMEIKGGNGAGKFSEMKDDYGIVPMPKYDTDQENYISPIAVWTYFLTVPASNPDLESASIILDAMSYLSYRDVVPKYYDLVLQVKHIRDEETSAMLDIIRDTRTYYTAYAFGFGNDLRAYLAEAIRSGNGGAASIVAQYKDATEAEMKTAMVKFNSK